MLPNLRIMTLALDTVEESEMLSVEALSFVLKSDAARRARDLPLREGSDGPADGAREGKGLVGVGGEPRSEPAPGDADDEPAAVAAGAALALSAFAKPFLRLSLPSSLSLASSSADAALKERARRRRPLSPPERTMVALGTGTGSPSCESSLLMLRRLFARETFGVSGRAVSIESVRAKLGASARGVLGDGGLMVPEELGRTDETLVRGSGSGAAVEKVARPRGLGLAGRRTSAAGVGTDFAVMVEDKGPRWPEDDAVRWLADDALRWLDDEVPRECGGDGPEEVLRVWAWVVGLGLEPLRLRPEEPELREEDEPAASARAYGGWGGSAAEEDEAWRAERRGPPYGWKPG